jgi:signal transduction histidine kinase/CheY-like chemotaxis protein
MLSRTRAGAEWGRHLSDLVICDERPSRPRLQTEDAARPPDPVATDPVIAELMRSKAAAEAANEAKSRYLVAVSHEIRSPLNAIYGYAQLLERGDAISGAEAGAAIRRSVDHLTSLAESLLELSHVESGVLKIQSDVVDIRSLLDQTISMFRAQAMTKGLNLLLNVSDRLPALVKTDQKRLKQVLINLVSNAIKYTEAGHVELRVDHRNEVATIDVIDTGIGIEPDDLARAFEPFERGRSSRVQSQPGIGLGLAITRVLVQVLGGEITASSTPEGSRFRVKLMLSSVAPAREDEPGRHVVGYSGPRRTVLIVEDEPGQRAALHSLLTSLDFVVHVAETGIEGIDLAARYSPDMVLLDVEMPGISGWETAKTLRAVHGAKLKIVLVTARMTNPEAGDSAFHAYDAMLAKPIAFDALFTTMQRLGVQWKQSAPDQTHPAIRGAADVSVEARPYLGRLHRAARMGHVLEFEKQLAELEHAVPAAASFAAMLRTHLDEFDFGAIIEKIENARA